MPESKSVACYCSREAEGFTCNACVNIIIEEKNRVVRENWVLRSKVEGALPKNAVEDFRKWFLPLE